MKRSTLSMIFLGSVVLSQHAQCADAGAAMGPLTAAEQAQCRTQRTELNQSAQAIKAELKVIQALGDEIASLEAAIEQERATLDRRDSAAVQALNAQVAKKNALSNRHNQMAMSVETISRENNQRAARIYDMCENRPVAPPPSSTTQP